MIGYEAKPFIGTGVRSGIGAFSRRIGGKGMTRFPFLLLGMALAFAPSAAEASGFALREYSGSAQGNANAGATASAEDVSYMAYNPAGITRHRGSHLAVNVAGIVPRSRFSLDGSTTVLGGNIGGGNGGSDAAPDVLVPALFYSHEITPRLFAGVSLTVPFGLSTDYEPGWAGRYHALKTELTTFDLNPVVAYKLTPRLSVAGGIRIAYTRGELSNAVDFGTLDALPVASGGMGGAFGGTPAQDDGHVRVEGDDIAWGFNLGLLYELAPGTRIGFAYRSRLQNQLTGSARFNNGAVGNSIAGATNMFASGGVRATLNLPETASAGLHHAFGERFAVMGEVAWTRWNRLKELRVRFDNPDQPDDVIPENWRNTWFVAAGATWRADERWTLRAGAAYDQTPVPDRTRTPRIPDQDRIWLSLGAGYQISPAFLAHIGYTRLFMDGARIGLSTADSANALRGNLNGRSSNYADILAIQVRMSF